MKITWFGAAVAVVAIGLFATSVRADELWLVDFHAAKEKAAKEGKEILMEFTGSDWCPPCKALQEKVLSKDVFREKMPEKYVLLKLDSPRDKSKQSPEEIEQYQKLSAEYKISGVPTIILADSRGRPFSKSVGFSGAEADDYVTDMVEKAALRSSRDERLAKADAVQGAERAKVLDKFLDEESSQFDRDVIISTYRDVVDQVVALDSDDALGMKSKFEGLIKTAQVRSALVALRPTSPNVQPDELLQKVDELIRKYEPTGEGLQETLMFKAQVLFQTDKPKAKELLLAAAEAAPDTDIAKQVPLIIERFFKDEEKKPVTAAADTTPAKKAEPKPGNSKP